MSWRAHYDAMTLGDAVEVRRNPWACACMGAPYGAPRGTPCSCALSVDQAAALHRAGHIVAKLVQSAADRPVLLTAEWVEGWLHWRCETAQGAWGLGRRILAGTAERG